MPPDIEELNAWKPAVIRVGDGRGFIAEAGRERIVITAAHCLPFQPPAASITGWDERTYKSLLGPLGKPPRIWCEVLFVDAVADLAVLGTPETQELADQAEAYDTLTESVEPVPIAALPYTRKVLREAQPGGGMFSGPLLDYSRFEGDAWVLSLDGRWVACRINARRRALLITDATDKTQAGMSGSPIVTRDGAIAVVVSGGSHGGGPQPVLAGCLPGWMGDDAL